VSKAERSTEVNAQLRCVAGVDPQIFAGSSSAASFQRFLEIRVDYRELFRIAINNRDTTPYPFQQRLAESPTWPLILDVPTGLGKTEAIVLGWIYRRLVAPSATARRLVYVLPQRTLVEQTARRARSMLDNLVAGGIDLGIGVEILMGGEVGVEYLSSPEAASILIGTQDMLLSRALNRGYAMSPFRWPMAFGWLHSDAWWIFDEVQLQGVGVTTAAQLQGLRSKIGTFGATATMFASATLDRSWIDTVDHRLDPKATTITLEDDDRAQSAVQKRVDASKTAHRLDVYEPNAVSKAVSERHAAGTRSLVIVNTVDRAVKVTAALRTLQPSLDVVLLHSRFRLNDREEHLAEALAPIEPNGPGRIVVATQVVEAGVDFSSRLLVSDVAPWSSIVQRLGRCNRTGDDADATFLWMEPPELTLKTAAPYKVDEVMSARDRLVTLEGTNLAPSALSHVPMKPELGATLRRVDLLELFDTSSDLSGNDIDVSRFIRDADDFTVRVLWREEAPSERDEPRREELCPATIAEARTLLKRLGDEGRRGDARVSRATSDEPWTAFAQPERLRIGDIVWIASTAGGYSPAIGFDPNSRKRVEPLERTSVDDEAPDDETLGSDVRSFTGEAMSIATHSGDAADEARALAATLVETGLLDTRFAAIVETSARWHDAGKIHPVFQATMEKAGTGTIAGPWAKSDGTHRARHYRKGFRHEVVSALAWLAAHDRDGMDADLVAYLIMAHHGKVRVSPQRLPMEPSGGLARTMCGVLQGESVPGADLGAGSASPAFDADLRIFDVGSEDGRATWGDRVGELCDDESLGIFRIAYLESLVRVADWRASALRHDGSGATS